MNELTDADLFGDLISVTRRAAVAGVTMISATASCAARDLATAEYVESVDAAHDLLMQLARSGGLQRIQQFLEGNHG